jgi:hypothetical protein
MSDDLRAMLKAHRARTALRTKLVWCSIDGDYLTANMCKHPLWRTCRRAGLRRIADRETRSLVDFGKPATEHHPSASQPTVGLNPADRAGLR